MTTAAGSTALVRFREGLAGLQATGATAHVSTLRFQVGLAVIGVALALGVSFVLSQLVTRTLPDLRCPACGKETKRIRRRTLHRIVTPILGNNISRRRCRECGWAGLVKDH